MDLQKKCACTVSAKKCSFDKNESFKNCTVKNHVSTCCLGYNLNNQEVAKVDKTLLCACENDKLITLDGVVAMRDSMKPYAFKRVVCPQPTIKKC